MKSTIRSLVQVRVVPPPLPNPPQLESGPNRANQSSASPADPAQTPNSPPAILDFLASNESLDRCGEVISARGWRLDHYLANPVFQNAHQYGDILFTLGKAIVTEVRGNGLFQRIQFATEANPVARIAFALYQGGFLNAVSVGFVPLRWENGSEKSGFRRRYLEQELLEVSAVAIPANPDALRLGYEAGAVNKDDLREAADLFAALALTTRDVAPSATTQHRHNRHPDPQSHWITLARQFADTLRA